MPFLRIAGRTSGQVTRRRRPSNSRVLSFALATTLAGLVCISASARAQLPADSILVRPLAFRSIGPAVMSGRIVDLAVAENPSSVRGGRLGTVVYAAAATGGIWKSTNAGINWTPVFDSVRIGSIGAVAVAPSNSDIVWVGTGEPNNMRSSSWGAGVFKSTDGGRTWSAPMLPKTQHIGRIVVDPRDPNVVYVAAVGPLWASGGDRGLYKTTDGGKTWTNTKNISAFTGFTEIVIDPSNPDVLYAASEQRERREYGFLPAGPEARIYKTTDAGRTWNALSNGLPTGEVGRIGLSVCRSRPSTVYAIIHAKGNMNGVYRTDDAGANWRLVNGGNSTAWYYGQVRCDPTDPDHVVRLLANSQESVDGGRTWTGFGAGGVHSDHHALWINPEAPEHMYFGTDGGLYISNDKGRTWAHVENIVAAQFYAVSVDDAQPFYNVYGGLQDNQAWGGPSRTRNSFGPTNADWFRMSGGDGFYAVPDPNDHNLVYAESQNGGVSRYDARTGQSKNIKPIPKDKEKHRYNWSAPILPSQHEPKVLYMAANYMFRSTDRGDSWETISPDLTRNIDRDKLPLRGAVPDTGALGRNEGTAEFSNISTIAESPLRKGLLVVGTDDGLIQVTRDGGKTWNKTEHFPGVPDTTYVSRVIWSNAAEGTLYATLDGHRSNDMLPYVVKSTDYGKTWMAITGDLPSLGPVQVIREHPRTSNLLFAGTEFGVFFTVDNGTHWTQLKSGIPGVPVWDLAIQPRWNDLVVGTHGRGVYIMDDLTPLEKMAQAKQATVAYMFPVRDELLLQPNNSRSSGVGSMGFTGQNPEVGARIAFTLNDIKADTKATLSIVDGAGTIIRDIPVTKRAGLYRPVWDMRVGAPLTGPIDTTVQPNVGRGGGGGGGGGGFGGRGGGGGPATFPALPGSYKARLTVAPASGAPTVLEQGFALRKDPMVTLTDAELKQLNQFRLNVARYQRILAEKALQADTISRRFGDAKRAADAAGDKVPAALKTEIAALDKEIVDLVRQVGNPPGQGGRGGFGGGGGGGGGAGGGGAGGAGGAGAGGAGAAGGATGGAGGGGAAGAGRGGAGRGGAGGGRGGAGAAGGAGGGNAGGNAGAAAPVTTPTPPAALTEEEQEALALVMAQTVQTRFGRLSETLNSAFNPSPMQRKTLEGMPTDIKTQSDRIAKLSSERLPALLKALQDAGVTVPAGGTRTP